MYYTGTVLFVVLYLFYVNSFIGRNKGDVSAFFVILVLLNVRNLLIFSSKYCQFLL